MKRRDVLGALALSVGGLRDVLAQSQPPAAITRDVVRPQLPSGVMTGDVDLAGAVLWSRTDRPARMLVELSTSESMRDAQRIVGPIATARTDHAARLALDGLAPGQTWFYRVRFADLHEDRITSAPLTGRFRTPSSTPRDVVFAFSGDEAGQGWGIDPDRGGYRVYETIRRFQPDFFIHSGDQIYADGPLERAVRLDDGTTWRNVVTEAKSRVAQSLDDFRGCFAYNLLDDNKRRFCAEVPMLVQWDDHEVRNNWFPGQRIGGVDTRYAERDVDTLAARARRAMFEYNAMRVDPRDPDRVYRAFHQGPLLDVFMLDERSDRGPNSPNRQAGGSAAAFLGADQTTWLTRSLKASRATWKVVASDMPLSIVVPDLNPDVPNGGYEAWANGDDGPPSGREREIARILAFIRSERIRNVVWVTADVHYASATRYDPSRARFTDFDPFWEFVGGPLNAGTFGPNAVDRTFGPDVRFVSVPADMKPNRPPSDGLQFFGIGKIDAKTRAMTVSLHDAAGARLFETVIDAA